MWQAIIGSVGNVWWKPFGWVEYFLHDKLHSLYTDNQMTPMRERLVETSMWVIDFLRILFF